MLPIRFHQAYNCTLTFILHIHTGASELKQCWCQLLWVEEGRRRKNARNHHHMSHMMFYSFSSSSVDLAALTAATKCTRTMDIVALTLEDKCITRLHQLIGQSARNCEYILPLLVSLLLLLAISFITKAGALFSTHLPLLPVHFTSWIFSQRHSAFLSSSCFVHFARATSKYIAQSLAGERERSKLMPWHTERCSNRVQLNDAPAPQETFASSNDTIALRRWHFTAVKWLNVPRVTVSCTHSFSLSPPPPSLELAAPVPGDLSLSL